MRVPALLFVIPLAGCGVKQLLPGGPVLGSWQRTVQFKRSPSGAYYSDAARTAFPVVPIIPWGAAYDVDLILVDDDPVWDMHEYAMLRGPDGPIWLAKDARLGTLQQAIVAELPGLASFVPEIPVHRVEEPVTVVDRSTSSRLDVDIAYVNVDGKQVQAHYDGPAPEELEAKRNGNTMGHSRDQLMAVLDVSSKAFAKHASVAIDGEKQHIHRIAGLVPFQLALVQTQAGVAVGEVSYTPADGGFTTTYHLPDGPVTAPWTIDDQGDRVVLRQESELRTVEIGGIAANGAWEMTDATVTQWGRATPVLHLDISPALPDMRRHFDGHVLSHYVIDVNGQDSHATGVLDAWWEADGPRVALRPEAPSWTVDRPMESIVVFPGDGSADVRVARVATDAKSGTGAKNKSPVAK